MCCAAAIDRRDDATIFAIVNAKGARGAPGLDRQRVFTRKALNLERFARAAITDN
jgi:hypothetical protein